MALGCARNCTEDRLVCSMMVKQRLGKAVFECLDLLDGPEKLFQNPDRTNWSPLWSIFTTLAELSGATIPSDRPIDGKNMAPILFQQGQSAHEYIFLYNSVVGGRYVVQAIRHGRYKAHYWTKTSCVPDPAVPHNPPLLFDIEADPSEEFPLSPTQHARIIEDFGIALNEHNSNMVPGQDQLSRGHNKKLSICCNDKTQCVCGQ